MMSSNAQQQHRSAPFPSGAMNAAALSPTPNTTTTTTPPPPPAPSNASQPPSNTPTTTPVYASPQVDQELERLIFHFLKTKGHINALQWFKLESKIILDLDFIDQCIMEGQFQKAEQYIQNFFPFDPSTPKSNAGKLYFQLRKAHLFDAHDSGDKVLVQRILDESLSAFKSLPIYQELTEIVPLSNLREHEKLRNHPKDVKECRNVAALVVRNRLASEVSLVPRLTVPPPSWKTIIDFFTANPHSVEDVTMAGDDDDFTLDFVPTKTMPMPMPMPIPLPFMAAPSAVSWAIPSKPLALDSVSSNAIATSRGTDESNGVLKRKRVDDQIPQQVPQPAPAATFVTKVLTSNTKKSICRVLFSNNGDSVIAIDEDGQLQIWRFATAAEMMNPTSEPTMLKSLETPKYLQDRKRTFASPFVVITHNDHYLIAGAGGPSVSLIQHNQKDSIQIAERGHIDLKDPIKAVGDPGVVTWIEFHPKNNNLLGVGFSSGGVGIFKFGKSTSKLIEMAQHPSTILNVVFHEDGKFVASFDRSSTVCIWNFPEISIDKPETGISEPEYRFLPTPAIGENIVAMCFRPRSPYLAVAGQKAIAIYSVIRTTAPFSGVLIKTPEFQRVSQELGCVIRSIAFSKDGKYVHCCTDKALVLLDADSLKEVCRVPSITQCRNVYSHPTDLQCVVGTHEGKVMVVKYTTQ